MSTSTEQFKHTDLGNAERFAATYGKNVRWSETWNSWLVFNGKFWEKDTTRRVDQFAKKIIRSLYKEAATVKDEEQSHATAKYALALQESRRSIRDMLECAKSELPCNPDDFDQNVHLLNCQNGTVDLRTGVLRQHDANDMLMRCCSVSYDPQAAYPEWDRFIQTIFSGNQALIAFIQQALGMSLSGDVSEECLFICHGGGNNGKTTLLERVRIILGAYAQTASIDTFMAKRDNDMSRHGIAALCAARFVTAAENMIGSRLNEPLIKKITSNEAQTAERKYEHEFQFRPEYTFWLAVNHKPEVKDATRGMWRRLRYIPFDFTFADDQVDTHFGDKLAHEHAGILAWLVQGCIAWYQQGRLVVPEIVTQATQDYRAEMDTPFTSFVQDICTIGNGETKAQTLYEAYEVWCANNHEEYRKTDATKGMENLGLKKVRKTRGWHYQGITIQIGNAPTDEETEAMDSTDLSADLDFACVKEEGMNQMNHDVPISENFSLIRVHSESFEKSVHVHSSGSSFTPIQQEQENQKHGQNGFQPRDEEDERIYSLLNDLG